MSGSAAVPTSPTSLEIEPGANPEDAHSCTFPSPKFGLFSLTGTTSYVVAESRSAVESESGDVRFSGAKVAAEIGQILSGAGVMEIPRDRRVLFKSVGMAIEDLTAARLVWRAIGKRKSELPRL